MKPLTLAAVAEFAKGALEQGRLEDKVNAVSTDTRTIQPGALYVPLRGERFDGHDFVQQAADAGAAAVMAGRGVDVTVPGNCALLRVADTLLGLQTLAKRYREHLGLTVIGVTGSSGKTTTKDLIAAVLSAEFAVSATAGNFNNHIGLPLTILSADDRHEMGVWEMGMSNPGEIAALAALAQPDVAVITNVGVAHIEFLGSREAIASEKGALAEAIGERGLVVLNGEDDFCGAIAKRTNARVATVGFERGDFRAEEVRISAGGASFILVSSGGRVPVELPVSGRHMILNALLAAAVGSHLGVGLEAVARGLAGAAITGGRLQHRAIGGVTYFDDSYNANPDSMRAALATLAEIGCEGRRFAVVGEMGELGESAGEEHRKVGETALELGIDMVLSVGAPAREVAGAAGGAGHHFESHDECVEFLKAESRAGDVVLIKGSRAAGMEKVMEGLAE